MNLYTVITTEFALNDLKIGRRFYEKQSPELGDYFFDALLTDIESLHLYAGVHTKEYGFYKMLSKRFPYTVYYDIENHIARIVAVLDQRRNPMTTYTQLSSR